MSYELSYLLVAAASIGFFHTLFGPDHYLPFIVMSKSGNWSLRKTSVITFLCGFAHVLSSTILGAIGVAFGIGVSKLEALESVRGNLAAWVLIAFGLVYFIWGVRQAIRNQAHEHTHSHTKGVSHEHTHDHNSAHLHAHTKGNSKDVTPWMLFAIFIFGPCEPLIPLLMYPAAKGNLWSLVSVTATFGVVTIATMMTVVLVSTYGASFVSLSKLERYTHALAGATIFFCGISIQFLGL
jgi:nickel/cobalt exporter